jgi:predicted TIM-barrel fold metal-dependent hydrolase
MRLDLPICSHVGRWGGGDLQDRGRNGSTTFPFPQAGVFHNLAVRGVPDRFPTLRFGVIEAMASWVPYLIADLKAKMRHLSGPGGDAVRNRTDRAFNLETDFLRANRFYVTCQPSDDVPYLLKFGADNLLIGTDYGHSDQSSVMDALDYIERLGEDGEIPMEAARKILDGNPRAFYGL